MYGVCACMYVYTSVNVLANVCDHHCNTEGAFRTAQLHP